jgi:hypothetical protein
MLSEREGDHGAEAAAGVCRMKGTWSFRVIPINQIANFYRHELYLSARAFFVNSPVAKSERIAGAAVVII